MNQVVHIEQINDDLIEVEFDQSSGMQSFPVRIKIIVRLSKLSRLVYVPPFVDMTLDANKVTLHCNIREDAFVIYEYIKEKLHDKPL